MMLLQLAAALMAVPCLSVMCDTGVLCLLLLRGFAGSPLCLFFCSYLVGFSFSSPHFLRLLLRNGTFFNLFCFWF